MLKRLVKTNIVCALIGLMIRSADASEVVSQPRTSTAIAFPLIQTTQLRLNNGMVVWLKSNDCERGEVSVRLAALGGYASFPEGDRASAELAPLAAWESGMDSLTSDQVSVHLYENAIELESNILPFSRVIAANSAASGAPALFKYLEKVFTEQPFAMSGWQVALAKTKDDINKLRQDPDRIYETAFILYNTCDFPALRAPTVEMLDHADFARARDLFKRSFSDPSEFVCIVVGDFNLEEMRGCIENTLGRIPTISQPKWDFAFAAPFPKGITDKKNRMNSRSDNVVRLTFPLQITLTEELLPQVAFACQIIETRLLQIVMDKMDLSYGVDVSYEFPLYPLLSNPWMSIRFRSKDSKVEALSQIILKELKHLQQNGVTEIEVETMRKLEFSHQDFWLQDNGYWVSMLMNYALWGWDPEKIIYANTPIRSLTAGEVNKLVKEMISLQTYSRFIGTSSKPLPDRQ